MLPQYRTVSGYGEAAFEIEKSRFIAYADRAETPEAAQRFIAAIRKKHWDATHNCAAYMCGERDETQKADDDGEPSGTAGKPILEVIKKMGLKDSVVVVTRYFGGIKLGAGGLIRAYGKSASVGLQAAGIIERRLFTPIAMAIDYGLYGKFEQELRLRGYRIMETQFGAAVTVIALEEAGQEERLEKMAADWSSGCAELMRRDAVYVDAPVNAQ
ncbi:YigZ family protein [Heliobacterium gestii]|uniref:YigZ family protein n=1 Tax=Heliomicrobium gestii TaxID=2699 RepID=A0A845LCZ4_HELGE|nr:YigZ family protein [Heliomicrobium gestii]MBM7866164.1 putative YigZ family protein [Heliomicrobium gestii]MZP42509.1 YigZ family protein [Heliomicrobium gestii]